MNLTALELLAKNRCEGTIQYNFYMEIPVLRKNREGGILMLKHKFDSFRKNFQEKIDVLISCTIPLDV